MSHFSASHCAFFENGFGDQQDWRRNCGWLNKCRGGGCPIITLPSRVDGLPRLDLIDEACCQHCCGAGEREEHNQNDAFACQSMLADVCCFWKIAPKRETWPQANSLLLCLEGKKILDEGKRFL